MFDIPGRAWILFAFDVGRAIDLARCRTLITAREVAGARRPEWPHLFGLSERPLVWSVEPVTVALDGRPIELQVRLILYDFGNVSVAVSGPIAVGETTPPLWAFGRTDDVLERLAADKLAELVDRVGAAIKDPQPVVGPTRYSVLHLDAVPGREPHAWLRDHGAAVARLLRGETTTLSDAEVGEALGRAVSYGVNDLVVVDSLSALVIDEAWEDTLAVLDFANCERLTMQTLDDELDGAIESAGTLLRSRASRLRLFLVPWGKDLRRLTRLTLDVTSEYEAVENAIKLTGDDYLARVYRMAIERFHLRPFQEGITRKLQSLWNIQQVFLEQASARRSEMLEWIIIVLIAIDILKALV